MVPLRVSSPPSATSKTEPETTVAPLITLWLPLAASTSAPLTVCHLPPEIVPPESSTTAPLPDARILPLLLLRTPPSTSKPGANTCSEAELVTEPMMFAVPPCAAPTASPVLIEPPLIVSVAPLKAAS